MYNVSVEALNYQSTSSLGLALEKVFQEAIDYRDSIPFDQQQEKVKKYCRDKLKNNLVKVYKSVANITVQDVKFIWQYPSLMFAIMMGKDEKQAIMVHSLSDIGYGLNKIDNPSKELKEISELYKATINKEHKLGSTNYGKNESLSIVLYFDAGIGLLGHHYISPDICEPLTAKELAALYLHETGHLYYALERFEDSFYCVNRITSQLTSLSSKYSSTDIADAILDNQKDLEEVAKTSKDPISAKSVDLAIKAANTVKYLKEKSEDELKYISVAEAIIGIITKTIAFVLINVYYGPIFYILSQLGNLIFSLDHISKSSSTKKYSDMFSTEKDWSNREKDADEYAVRSGYGEYLISSMTKFGKMEEAWLAISNTIISYNQLQSISAGYNILSLFSIFYKNIIYNESMIIYESTVDRCASMCRNMIPALKSLPPEEQGIWILRYEQMSKQYAELQKNSKSFMNPIINFYNMVTNSPGTLLETILSGRIANDYYKLQKQLEELVNNKLYFYGLKLKQLGR